MDTTTEPPPEAPQPSPDPAPPPRRPPLVRDGSDRLVAGVAAGIARHLSVEPVYVRLGFVVATFFGGIGVLAYVVAWIAIPSEIPVVARSHQRDRRQLIGFGLVALGIAVIPGGFGFDWDGGALWPVALIAIGGAVLWLRSRDARDEGRPAAVPSSGPASPPDAAPTETASPASPVSPVPSTDLVPAAASARSWSAPPAGPVPTAEDTPTLPIAPAPVPKSAPGSKRERRPKSSLGAITVSALLVLAGLAWLVDLVGIVSVDIGVLVAVALAFVGSALVVSAWIGRSRGLIALGLILTVAAAAFGVIDVPLRGGIGDTTYRPSRLAPAGTTYEMAIGRLSVDLRAVDLAGRRREVTATIGVGKLEVIVPEDARVVVAGHAGAGTVQAFARRSQDCCPVEVHTVSPGDVGGGTLVLTAEVGAGNVEIKRQEATRGTS